MNLLDLTLQQQQAQHDAAVAALHARSADIALLERLGTALRARGWNAQPHVTIGAVAGAARCELWLHLSATQVELADVIEFLGADGVSASRVLHHERRTLRHYSLRLGSCTVQLHAYIHAAREAA
jgi:hypothetical protein